MCAQGFPAFSAPVKQSPAERFARTFLATKQQFKLEQAHKQAIRDFYNLDRMDSEATPGRAPGPGPGPRPVEPGPGLVFDPLTSEIRPSRVKDVPSLVDAATSPQLTTTHDVGTVTDPLEPVADQMELDPPSQLIVHNHHYHNQISNIFNENQHHQQLVSQIVHNNHVTQQLIHNHNSAIHHVQNNLHAVQNNLNVLVNNQHWHPPPSHSNHQHSHPHSNTALLEGQLAIEAEPGWNYTVEEPDNNQTIEEYFWN